jgi:hypothetical protein
MSETLYSFQTLIIGLALLSLFRNHSLVVRLQIVTWTVGVIVVAWRFGLVDQLDFYSNDQRYYQQVVETLLAERTLVSEAFSIEASKIPFTGSALILAAAGVHPALALKTISQISLLVLTSDILRKYKERNQFGQLQILFFTGCGGIGAFFSILALRETMMMMFVYRYATSMSTVSRILSAIAVYLLRPHLAVALLVGELLATLWRWQSRSKRISQLSMVFFTLTSAITGSVFFSLQAILFYGTDTLQIRAFTVSNATRIASNFVGLQFLSVQQETVDFPLISLFLLRLLFSETVLIPLSFTFFCLAFAQKMNLKYLSTLAAFTVYVSIVTNTDFNSFRQNIPFMPLLGCAIMDMIRTKQFKRADLSLR